MAISDYLGYIVVGIIILLCSRWIFGDDAETSSAREGSTVQRSDRSRVEIIRSMFPNTPAVAIAYDLQKTRSVETTTEKLLAGATLPLPPDSSPLYRQYEDTRRQPAAAVAPESSHAATPSSSRGVGASVPQQDLVTRFNLAAKVNADHADDETPVAGGWSPVRSEREQLFRKRREDMILRARRALQQQQQQKE